jgi:prolyl-tRNA synthetase
VAADTGAIGGDLSEEFQVIAATGEDAIVYCPGSDYAANMEKAEAAARRPAPAPAQALAKTPTPGKSTCADVAALLGLPLAQTVKSLVLATDTLDEQGVVKSQVWLLLLRGDHDMNESRWQGAGAGRRLPLCHRAEIEAHFGCKPGYLGPIGLKKPVKVVADREVALMADWVCGANEEDFHITGVNWGRDLPEPDVVADMRNVVAGDVARRQGRAGDRARHRDRPRVLPGHQVQPRHERHLPGRGRQAQPFEMGCYGIGVTRLPAAAIEQNHDERGIIWPDAIAPFTVVICPMGMDRSEAVKAAAEALYAELLAAGVDVILDDRGERPGAMFADWELIGVPHRVTIGDRA